MTTPRIVTLLWAMVAATAMVTPLVVTPTSFDIYRVAKHATFVSLALLIAAVLAAAALTVRDRAWLTRVPVIPATLAAAAVVWSAVAAMTSQRPVVSMHKPLTVFAMAAFFVAAMVAMRGPRLVAIVIGLVPAIVNATIALLQSTHIWTPWKGEPPYDVERLRTTALLGNPNEVGTYLVIPAVAAFAAAVAWRKHRWWLAALSALIVAGVVSSQSVAPFGAALVGLVAVALTVGTWRFRIAAVLIVIALAGAAMLHPGARERAQLLVDSIDEGKLPEVSSYRIVPFAAAWMMFREHPLTGVGPGSFAALYMSHKERMDTVRPQWIRMSNENYGEVHNDHLQLLAETGLPGYALYVAALLLLVHLSVRRNGDGNAGDEPGARFARLFGLPAAVAFAVLTLAQFPMQLTAPMVSALYFAALALTWREAS